MSAPEPSRRKTVAKVTLVSPPLGAEVKAIGAGAETEKQSSKLRMVHRSELAVIVAPALDPPACLEPRMLMAGFDFIVPEAPIMIVQVPTIAA